MIFAYDPETGGPRPKPRMTRHVRFWNARSRLNPDCCEAHWSAGQYLIFNWQLWGGPKEPNLGDALALAQRAVDIDPNDSTARCALGYMLLYNHRWAEAEHQYDVAIRLNPNNAYAFCRPCLFQRHERQASAGRAVSCPRSASQPRPPAGTSGSPERHRSPIVKYSDAVGTLRREETYRSASRRMLAAALALLGRVSEAQAEAKLFSRDKSALAHQYLGGGPALQETIRRRILDKRLPPRRIAGMTSDLNRAGEAFGAAGPR